MEKLGKWQVLKQLGQGGQGRVDLVLDTSKVNLGTAAAILQRDLSELQHMQTPDQRPRLAQSVYDSLKQYDLAADPSNLGALKRIHQAKDPPGYAKAIARLKREVETYKTIKHPNLLRMLDADIENVWFVAEYHPRGPLSEVRDIYQGQLLEALRAIRPVIDAVSALHKAGFVHRDIKPENLFVSVDKGLILGDAGIVFFADAEHTRLSDTFENVGSRDWMPSWAYSMRVDDLKPSFDVFSLGKVLWAMVSGLPACPLWYIHESRHELTEMFPGDLDMQWAGFVLDHCVVEKEEDCLVNATHLLDWVDGTIRALNRHAQVVGESIQRTCTVCGLGRYEYVSNEDYISGRNFGVGGAGHPHKIFACPRCGHVQIFRMGAQRPSAWPPR